MRAPQVTRTMESTKVTVLTVNTVEQTTEVKEFILPRTYKDNEKILNVLRKMDLGENVQPVSIHSVEVQTKLYGMSEADFMKYAKELDRETRKAL
jgi:hypothetical protein